MNVRRDFLLTTFPVSDLNRFPAAPVIFPHLADSGGYVTEFILFGTGRASTQRVNFFDGAGIPLPVGR
jgi:hypothetical protein